MIRGNANLTFSIVCHQKSPDSGSCTNVNLLKIVALDEKYFPREFKIDEKPSNRKTGERANFEVKLN